MLLRERRMSAVWRRFPLTSATDFRHSYVVTFLIFWCASLIGNCTLPPLAKSPNYELPDGLTQFWTLRKKNLCKLLSIGIRNPMITDTSSSCLLWIVYNTNLPTTNTSYQHQTDDFACFNVLYNTPSAKLTGEFTVWSLKMCSTEILISGSSWLIVKLSFLKF